MPSNLWEFEAESFTRESRMKKKRSKRSMYGSGIVMRLGKMVDDVKAYIMGFRFVPNNWEVRLDR